MLARRLLPLVLALAVAVPAHLVGAAAYEVRPGDTLSAIADRLGLTVEELAAANGIDDPDFIVAGHLLVLPADGGMATSYVVRQGDTLSGIADRLGVPISRLADANAITDADHVEAGQLLSVTGWAKPGAGRYTVREGDTLTDVADRLGVSLSSVVEANGIDDPSYIYPGQVLTVPGGGGWICPVPGASFVNDYAYVKPDGWRHDGVDMFAPRGTPVLAPEGGTATAFPNPSGGLAVHLRKADGTRYYFAHLDGYGDTGRVSPGDVIGYVGNTGDARATEPHVHFEVHPGGGESINPFPSLVTACR